MDAFLITVKTPFFTEQLWWLLLITLRPAHLLFNENKKTLKSTGNQAQTQNLILSTFELIFVRPFELIITATEEQLHNYRRRPEDFKAWMLIFKQIETWMEKEDLLRKELKKKEKSHS